MGVDDQGRCLVIFDESGRAAKSLHLVGFIASNKAILVCKPTERWLQEKKMADKPIKKKEGIW